MPRPRPIRSVPTAILIAAAASLGSACASGAVPSAAEPRPEAWIDRTLADMTLREKVAQLIVPWIGGDYLAVGTEPYHRLRGWIEQGIGGFVISIGPPLEVAAKLDMLQRMADVPLLVAADMEHGPGQRLNGATIFPYGLTVGGGTEFPPVMAVGAAGDPALAYELGRITALEARAVGVHMIYAPVVDVNNNPANPIINTRSYGQDPERVATMVAAHVRGLQEHGALATAKHFPGHGDTGTDSHIELPVITVDRGRADAVELVPFRAAIEAGVAAVMSAHIVFPALTGDSVPATLSPALLDGLLREELGFDGLVVTDALDMGAIVRGWGGGEAAVRALLAGADVLLMPPDIDAAIAGVAAAVAEGRLTEARIDASVRRLLAAKTRVGLHHRRTVDLEAVPERVGIPAHLDVAERVAERSLTLARDRPGLLPLPDAARVALVVYSDDADPFAGRTLQRTLAERRPGLDAHLLTGDPSPTRLDAVRRAAAAADVVVFAPFVRVLSHKGDVAVDGDVAALVRELAAERPVAVVSFGNPYLLGQFPEIGTYLLAWGQEAVTQRAVARALAGAIPVTGRLPTALPPHHAIGDGIRLDGGRAAGGQP